MCKRKHLLSTQHLTVGEPRNFATHFNQVPSIDKSPTQHIFPGSSTQVVPQSCFPNQRSRKAAWPLNGVKIAPKRNVEVQRRGHSTNINICGSCYSSSLPTPGGPGEEAESQDPSSPSGEHPNPPTHTIAPAVSFPEMPFPLHRLAKFYCFLNAWLSHASSESSVPLRQAGRARPSCAPETHPHSTPSSVVI